MFASVAHAGRRCGCEIQRAGGMGLSFSSCTCLLSRGPFEGEAPCFLFSLGRCCCKMQVHSDACPFPISERPLSPSSPVLQACPPSRPSPSLRSPAGQRGGRHADACALPPPSLASPAHPQQPPPPCNGRRFPPLHLPHFPGRSSATCARAGVPARRHPVGGCVLAPSRRR